MKVIVADTREEGNVSSTDYHWCDDGDLLMFGQFQLGNGNPSEVSMCGIKSSKFTTHILIKDLKIDEDFYRELLIESIEKSMNCKVDEDGNYGVGFGDNWDFNFNVNDIMKELLDKASKFEDGQKVKCFGRDLTPIIKSEFITTEIQNNE